MFDDKDRYLDYLVSKYVLKRPTWLDQNDFFENGYEHGAYFDWKNVEYPAFLSDTRFAYSVENFSTDFRGALLLLQKLQEDGHEWSFSNSGRVLLKGIQVQEATPQRAMAIACILLYAPGVRDKIPSFLEPGEDARPMIKFE